jgi:hypothetical protein
LLVKRKPAFRCGNPDLSGSLRTAFRGVLRSGDPGFLFA